MAKCNEMLKSFSEAIAVLQFIGLYPVEKHSKIFKIWGFCLYLVLGVSMNLLLIVNIAHKKNVNVNERNFIMMYLSEVCFGTMKILPFLVNGPRIKKCMHYFAHARFSPKNDAEKKILASCSEFCQKLCRIFLVAIFLGVQLWSEPSLFSNSYTDLPVNIWLPYDPNLQKNVYYTTWTFVFVAVWYDATSVFLVDVIIVGLAYYAISHVKILRYTLTNLDKFANNELFEGGSITYESVDKVLRQCVRLHTDIIEFMNDYRKCFAWGLFCQFAGSMLCLCFSCIGMSSSNIPIGSVDFFKAVIAGINVTFQIFFYSYFGTLVFEESSKITYAIYLGPWYRCDVRIKKILIMIMERSKQPLRINAGPVIQLSLQVFVSTVKTSYSLIAVMKTRI